MKDDALLKDLPVTSMADNAAYAAVKHKDKHNVGASLLLTCGDFRGSEMQYWLADDEEPIVLNPRPPVIFTWQSSHAVQAFDANAFVY